MKELRVSTIRKEFKDLIKTLLAKGQVHNPKVPFDTRKILYDAFHITLHI